MIESAAATHPGLKRTKNEDCYESDPEAALWLVADGVGGHADGEVASSIVTETVRASLSKGIPLLDSIHLAHAAVLAEIPETTSNSNMGSTVVALSMTDSGYSLAWVGDSRAYLWNGRVLTQLTRDHTQIARLIEQGIVTYKEARSHPARHILTQSLGVSADMAIEPEVIRGKLGEGNQILLCSDGLTDELEDRDISAILQRNESPQSQVDALLKAALDAGGNDNITIVLVGSSARSSRGEPLKAYSSQARNTSHSISRATSRRTFWLTVSIMGIVVVLASIALSQ